MKTKQFILTLSTVVLAGSLMFTSCRKKTQEQEDPDKDQTAAQENQLAENYMNDVAGIGSQGSENGSLSTYKGGGAQDVFGISSASLTFGPGTFTVDFGPLPGVNCMDGRKRSGKLMFDYSASTNSATAYRHPGYKLSITSSNYTVDDYTVNIVSKNISNTTPTTILTGTNPGVNLTWNVTANVNIIKPAGGGTITWSCNRNKTLVNTSDPLCYKGQSLPIDWSKARVQIDGNASGMTAAGENYTAYMIGMTRDFAACGSAYKYPWIKGNLNFTPGTKATRYINFGNGSCDRTAVVTINGIDYTFNF